MPPSPSRRGGPRPGAGAPRGNLNALKTGRYSAQVQALNLAIRVNKGLADLSESGSLKEARRRRLFALTLQHVARRILESTGGTIKKRAKTRRRQLRGDGKNSKNQKNNQPCCRPRHETYNEAP